MYLRYECTASGINPGTQVNRRSPQGYHLYNLISGISTGITLRNRSENDMPSPRKDRLYLLLAYTAAISIFVCLCIAFLAIEKGATGIAFLFASAVLLFIWPLLMMFMTKYAQGHESLQWLRDLIATDDDDTPKINFIGF